MGEKAIFTAIPAGRLPDSGELKVTVFVTPRLDTAEWGNPADGVPLSEFEAFFNWPRTVEGARFLLDVSGFGTVEAFPADPVILADRALWDTLFSRTSVGQAAFQHFEDAIVHSYPVAEVATALTRLYQTVAVVSPTRFPPITRGPLLEAVNELDIPPQEDRRHVTFPRRAAIRDAIADLRGQSDARGRYLDIDVVPPADREKVAFAAASAFYDRHDDPWSETETAARAPKPVPPEFHSFVARCADYPELLRRLGLAFDLFIRDDAGIPENTTIRVLDGQNDGVFESLLAPTAARPQSMARHTERVWAPRSEEDRADVRDGSLTIDRTDAFALEQLDPDGSALKLANLLGTLRRIAVELNAHPDSMTADASSLPALKSAGILIARKNRAAGLVGQFDQAAGHESKHQAGNPAVLDVTDLTRGWRVDVQDLTTDTRDWMSLHRREGLYEVVSPEGVFTALPDQLPPDEGYLKAASTSSNKPKPGDDQYLHETLVGWDGWSLAAKRPGRSQQETDVVLPEQAPDVADSGFPLAVSVRPARGSLPRLRYGRSYRMRVRAVDLSGGSIPAEQLDESHERDVSGTYQRWEPVPSPAVVPLKQFTEGESLMRMVIRSTDGVSTGDYVALDRVTGLAGHDPAGVLFREQNERHLAAPISGVQLAETHGMLDTALSGVPAAVAEQFAVAAKESGSYLTLPGGRVIRTADPANATVLTGDKSQLLGEGEYVVHDTPSLELPYLPDPLSRGISFKRLPGDTQPRALRWPGEPQFWHDRRPVLLRVVEGTAAPVFDDGSRTLTVFLPKSEFAVVRLSSFLDPGDPELMRIWNLIDEYQKPATVAQREAVLAGLHWMITPYAELTLVHAVEKPLEKPVIVIAPAGVRRQLAETFVGLAGVVHNHAASTGRIDITARWDDPIDDVVSPKPSSVEKRAQVAGFQLERVEVDARIALNQAPAGGPFLATHEARHEFGDTRHRYVDYMATATTRFREYFPAEITDKVELVTTVGDPITLDIPSSARPESPDVRYLVPTWQWTTEELAVESPFAVRRVRTGGGLRVYLGRPWYSSGPDELLGVVVRLQPWLGWVRDVEAGVAGSLEARGVADAWARAVLDHESAEVSPAMPVTTQLETLLAVSQTEVFAEQLAVNTVEERFLADTQSAIAKARVDERATVGTVIDTGVMGPFLTLFDQTGPEALRFTSVWGSDPVFDSTRVDSGPYIHQFPLRTNVGHAVSLAEVAGERVTVIGHQPDFDPERKLWFCDLQLEAGSSYTPMVQLVLARYQPHSLDGQHLSKVVKADFVQLVPRREATFVVTPDASAVVVTLAGVVGIPLHAKSLPDRASRINASRLVQTWVEKLPADAATDLAWQQVGRSVTLPVLVNARLQIVANHAIVDWAGAVSLPERMEGDRVRVRIAEYELHVSDRAPGFAIAPFNVRDHRLVYSDTVEIAPMG